MNKKIYLIRSNKSKFGGAENYLSRLAKALEIKNINHQIIKSPFPKFLPSWLRSILFNFQLYFLKQDKFYFSLERITCPDVYRAGDGVHKVFLSIENAVITFSIFLILFIVFITSSYSTIPIIFRKKSTFFFSGIKYVFVSDVSNNSLETV